MALVGGAYHESWHSLYSCRRPLTTYEMCELVLPRWDLVPDWSLCCMVLLDLTNTVEDIRIERLGTRMFPGAWTKMHDLQDYIIQQEQIPLAEHGLASAFHDVGRTFREYGLGYSTPTVVKALGSYQERNPGAYYLVTDGSLTPLLRKSISLGESDDISCLEIGMEILGVIYGQEKPAQEISEEIPITSEKTSEETPEVAPEETPEVTSSVMQELQKSMAAGERLQQLTYNAIAAKHIQQLHAEEDTHLGENTEPYRSFNPSLNKLQIVPPSKAGPVVDRRMARGLLRSVRRETVFLQARLRSLVLDQNEPSDVGASRIGVSLHLPSVAQTGIEVLLHKTEPSRPFEATVSGAAPSTATVLLIDQSASMHKHLKEVQKAVLSLADCFESILCPTMAVGFRDGDMPDPVPSDRVIEDGLYHRVQGVDFDLFKSFEEPLHRVVGRFANIQTKGSTPMADGIHLALSWLKARREKQRLIFLFTDGMPTGLRDPKAVVRGLIAKAEREHCIIVAVGIGTGAEPVAHLFPDHVWGQNFESLPKLVLDKLYQIFKGRSNVRPTYF